MTCRRLPLAVVLMLALMVLWPAGLSAGQIEVLPYPQVTAPYGIRDIITGADMAGLVVRAAYGGWSEAPDFILTLTWAATGPTSGAASYTLPGFDSPGFFLSLDGETSRGLAWQYRSMYLTPLLSIELDGTFAGVYFDRSSPNPGTPGSGPGADITFRFAVENVMSLVTYENAVAVGANPPQGDLYARVVMRFEEWPWGGLSPQDFSFTQDTDHGVVPEPASGLLVCGGLVGFRAWRKRRQ